MANLLPPAVRRWIAAGTGLRIVLGLFLVFAAGFKVHALWTGTAEPISLLRSARAQIAVIELEAVIGLWLLTGKYASVVRMVAIGFFSVLAATSLYLAMIGQSSCGCFGRLHINPWLTFAIDTAAVTALLSWAPLNASTDHRVHMRAALRPIAGTFVVLLAFTVAFVLTVDDAQSALARLRGDLITVDPVTSDVGVGSPGERREVTVSLTNHTRHRIRCIGGTATCGCFATEDLPLALEPHESRQIRVRLRFRGSPGVFKDRFLIYTDHQDQPVVYAALAGRVTAPQ